MISRRTFLLNSTTAGVLLGLDASPARSDTTRAVKRSGSLKILLLGGTGNIGPHFIDAALARGHHVAVFSRGKRSVDLPPAAEHLIGDRETDLASIQGRDWDAVLDLATYAPEWVKTLGEAIASRVKQYLFISTVSVYDHPELNDRTLETSQVLESVSNPGEKYGVDKVLCEREALKQFGTRTLILRPSYIVGPRDQVGFLSFWPLRMQRRGDMLVPGDRGLPFQCIDVRDLAAFALRLIEKGTSGTFNVVGPASVTTFGQFIDSARDVASGSVNPIWLPARRIASQPDAELWRKSLFWSWYSESSGQANIMRMSNTRALAAGLTVRPLKDTIADTLAWYRQQPAAVQATLAPGYQREQTEGRQQSAEALWNTYLTREAEVLAAWRASHS